MCTLRTISKRNGKAGTTRDPERILWRHRSLALDTNIFIYQLEGNLRYSGAASAVFSWTAQAGHQAVTSSLTMTEILVHPYRHGGQNRARDYYSLLVSYPNLAWIPTDLRIADLAARLRADYRMRRPDAIQAATATVFWATGLVTNDRIFARVPDFETLVFDDVS